MANEGITKHIIHYLNTPSPSYAVLLRGEWGVGKSFYWQRFKAGNAMPKDKTEITFSVAGLSTLEELERALFMSSIRDFAPGLQETGTVIARTLLRWVKVEPNDIKLRAAVRADRTVICIDDLERFNGDFKVLFGFIVSLLDEDSLHVILIADEERARDLANYDLYKERIIGRSFDVEPATVDFYQYVSKGFSQAWVRDALLSHKTEALRLFDRQCLRNLRTVRAVLDNLNGILAGVNLPDNGIVVLSRLFSAVTFYVTATIKNPSNADLVGAVFRHETLQLTLPLWAAMRGSGNAPGGNDSKHPMHNLIHDLGFENDAMQWPVSHNFAAYIQGQNFDPHLLATDFGIFGEPARGPEIQSTPTILEQLGKYRSMDEQQFRDAVTHLRAMIHDRQFQTLQEIWNAYYTWRHLANERLIRDTPDQCRDMFVEAISALEPESFTSANFTPWSEPDDANDAVVIRELRILETKVSEWIEKAVNYRLQRAIIEGNGHESSDLSRTPFAAEDAAGIARRLATSGRPAFNRMVSFFRQRFRIGNIADFTAKEAPFARQLAELVDIQAQAGDELTLDQAASRELASVLREFSDRVEKKDVSNS